MRPWLLLCLAFLAVPASAADLSHWAAVVVAADWQAEEGGPTKVFDNARHTITRELVSIGFSRANILQYSAHPLRDPVPDARLATVKGIRDGLAALARRTRDGCFVYFTSHGSDIGIVLGEGDLSPRELAAMVDGACGGRPAVVVVSACYSGIFVPPLKAPNRLVLTAASASRSSFGCGALDAYTYFDNCAVAELPQAGSFPAFAANTIACVKAREKKEQVDLPSRPQLAVGANAAAFPVWRPISFWYPPPRRR